MIGQHAVLYTPDPDFLPDESWGPPINTNSDFATDLSGWTWGDAGMTWTWIAGGQAQGTTTGTQSNVYLTHPPAGIPLPADVTTFRLTSQLTVAGGARPGDGLRLRVRWGPTGSTVEARFDAPAGTQTIVISTVVDRPAGITQATLTLEAWRDLTAVPIVPRVITVDYFRMEPLADVKIALVDLSCLTDQVTIHHGRSDTDSQPDASAATVELSETDVDKFPDNLQIGGALRITTTIPTIDGDVVFTRFTGRVTNLDTTWRDEGTETPNAPSLQLIATGILADLGRRIVGDAPWGQQLDGARVASIMSAAGIPLDPLTSDPGTVQILARDVDSQPALDLAQAVADNAGGIVWETREGEVRYADANHRRNIDATLQLDACDVLVTPMWSRSTDGLVNKVSIGYGPTPEEGEQPRYLGQRDDSIARYGTYSISLTTELAAQEDAAQLGQLLLTRNNHPVWILSALPIDVRNLDSLTTQDLLSLDLGALAFVTGFPVAGGSPPSAYLWVEGWDEVLAWDEHDMSLVVSGYCRTTPPPTWDEVDPAWTWDSLGGTLLSTNVHTNPGAEAASLTPGWISSNPALWPITIDTTAPIAGKQSAMTTRAALTGTQDPIAGIFQLSTSDASTIPANRFKVAPGQRMTASVRVRSENAREVAFVFQWRNPDGSALSNSTSVIVQISANVATTIVLDQVAPTGAAQGIPNLTVRTPGQATAASPGERVWVDSALVQLDGDPALPYFDGDTPDTNDYSFAWAGAANASYSTRSTGGSDWTWDDLSCLGPRPDRGRWIDVPASLRWNAVPSSVTWDRWDSSPLSPSASDLYDHELLGA
jgi:hypothetical protein